jgi:hypothetical protein
VSALGTRREEEIKGEERRKDERVDGFSVQSEGGVVGGELGLLELLEPASSEV